MKRKPALSFYTNIPTPYQLDFFNHLAQVFELRVIYYSNTENNREWRFNLNTPYEVKVLRNNFIAKLVQKKLVDFHFSWQIFREVWKDKSDYVIVGGAYHIPNAAWALLGSRIKGKKVAYFSEPLFVVRNRIKYLLKWIMLRILSVTCNAIFCTGRKAAESFSEYKVDVPKYIVPYNIDSSAFSKLDPEKLGRYRGMYRKNNETIILTSGSLIERKGMDILIKAFKGISDSGLRLLIMGDGPLRNALQELSNGDQRILFAGFQKPEDALYFFAIADVFAFASRYDGWAVVINEAIAAGVPVVSSNAVGAAMELITSGEDGIICESENVADFRAALKSLIESPAERERLRENALKLIPKVSSDHYAQYVYRLFTEEL